MWRLWLSVSPPVSLNRISNTRMLLRLSCVGPCCAGMIPVFRVRCSMRWRGRSPRRHGLILPQICYGPPRLPR
nr:MAG TPA: hypothetical protein [Caudoviricetes sp.]